MVEVLLLRTLPHDALGLIFRFCSPRSYSNEWRWYIEPDTVLLLHNLMPFSAQKEFKNLSEESKPIKNLDSFYISSRSPSGMRQVFLGDRLLDFPKLLSACTGISFGEGGILTKDSQAIAAHCSSLKELEVWGLYASDQLEKVIVARGQQILQLHVRINFPRDVSVLGTHCTHLQELKISGFPGCLQLLLPYIGHKLKKLGTCNKIGSDDMATIRSHCPRLEVLNVKSYACEHTLTLLLCAYGSQLRECSIVSAISDTNIHAITSICPNVRVQVEMRLESGSVHSQIATIRTLGNRISRLTLTDNYNEASSYFLERIEDSVRDILAHCTGLEYLILVFAVEDWEWMADCNWSKVFRAPLPILPNLLFLELDESFRFYDKEIELLAKATGQLRRLSLSVDYCTEGLQLLAAGNEELSHVMAHFDCYGPLENVDTWKLVCNVLRAFESCEKLRELEVTERMTTFNNRTDSSVKNLISSAYRHRRAQITVFNKQYFAF